MKVEFVGHQGDVLIYEVSEFPDGERYQDDLTKNHQVALGELSGHNHYFSETEAVDIFKLKEYPKITCFEVKKQTPLIHGLIKGFKGKESDQDYHHTENLKKGKYISSIGNETDWLTNTVRKIID